MRAAKLPRPACIRCGTRPGQVCVACANELHVNECSLGFASPELLERVRRIAGTLEALEREEVLPKRVGPDHVRFRRVP